MITAWHLNGEEKQIAMDLTETFFSTGPRIFPRLVHRHVLWGELADDHPLDPAPRPAPTLLTWTLPQPSTARREERVGGVIMWVGGAAL